VWERKDAYRVLVRKPGGRRPLGRARRKWEDNIRIDLEERVLKGVNWLNLAQVRNNCSAFCKHGNDLSDFIDCAEFLDQLWNY
jgi:hypothetical protein